MKCEQLCACRIKTLFLFLAMLASVTLLNEFVRQLKIFEFYALLRNPGGKKINFWSKNDWSGFNETEFTSGNFLRRSLPQNESYCQFNYGIPDELIINETFVSYSLEQGESSAYRVLYNVVEGSLTLGTPTQGSVQDIDVTYCTHVTPEFTYHVAEIVRRWEGPVSVAAFVPHTDANLVLFQINQLCHCLPEMSRVTLHFVFPEEFPPSVSKSCNDTNLEAEGCLKTTFEECTPLSGDSYRGKTQTFRYDKGLSYPVNVARNAAREAATTSHVLVSDVELLPSKGLVSGFRAIQNKIKRKYVNHRVKNYVFVVPVFEVDRSVGDVPKTKNELLDLYAQNKAVYFHKWICIHCQKFPGLSLWLRKTRNQHYTTIVQPFQVAKREFPYHRWEPVYIGTKMEPLYGELLSWEGRQDKMSQMAEMCLMGYSFIILDGAFLVHTPGIKRRSDSTNTAWRRHHENKNTRVYKTIIEQLKKKYSNNVRCKL